MTTIKSLVIMLLTISSSSLLAQQSNMQRPLDEGGALAASGPASNDQMWTTSEGTTRLPAVPRIGMHISTNYSQDSGQIHGILSQDPSGNWTLDGEWEEASSVRDCGGSSRYAKGPYWGKIRFVFNAQFTEFEGSWGYCADNPIRKWSGSSNASSVAPGSPVSSTARTRASKSGECDWKIYFQYVRDNGFALINQFERDTLNLAEQDRDNVIDTKLFPYSQNVRASFVSYDENEAIEKWEKLADEMIANQGADSWLKDKRALIILGYRNANREYWQSAYSQRACPGYNDPKGKNELLIELATGLAIDIRAKRLLPQELAAANDLREKYTRAVYRKLANTGTIRNKLSTAAKESVVQALKNDGIPQQKAEALTPQLDALREKFMKMEQSGRPPSTEYVESEMAKAFDRAGIRYNSPESRKAAENSPKEIGGWTFDLIKGAVFPPAWPNSITKGLSYVKSAEDHINIFKAIFDIGTLNTIEDKELSTINAITEDSAHLEVLIRRYELLDERFRKFSADYQALFSKAKKAATIK